MAGKLSFDVEVNKLPGFMTGEDETRGITLIRANCVEKMIHFAHYTNRSAIVMVLLAMSE